MRSSAPCAATQPHTFHGDDQADAGRRTGKYGLGLEIGGSSENPYFVHGGVNKGFEGVLVAYAQSGDGAVAMTNAQGGQRLANDILRSIAAVYGWPDFHPIIRATVRVDPTILLTYVGVYELTPTFSITITLENGQLMQQATNQRKFPLFPEFPTNSS